MSPLVSIIVPFFNSETFIQETLNSVRDQSYQNWECILVDDGSVDSSHEICKKNIQNDRRFKLFINDSGTKGVSSARNFGINLAQGEFILFLDSDDLLASDCLTNRVQYLLDDKELDFAVFQVESFGNESYLMTSHHENYLNAFISLDFPWTVMSALWRSTFIKKIGGFNSDLSRFEDPDFHIRALLKRPKFEVLYKVSPDSFYRKMKPIEDRKKNKSTDLKALVKFTTILNSYLDPFHFSNYTYKNSIFKALSLLSTPLSSNETDLVIDLINSYQERLNSTGVNYRFVQSFLNRSHDGTPIFFQKIIILAMMGVFNRKSTIKILKAIIFKPRFRVNNA